MRKISKFARIAGVVAVSGAAAIGALVVTPGTFGGFTSASSNPGNSVTAGTLTMTNSAANAAVVTAASAPSKDNMQPGDSATGSVTITNSGSLPADMTVSVASVVSSFPAGTVNLKINEGSTVVYDNAVTNAGPLGLGSTWTAGESHTYTVTVSIPSTAGDAAQGKTASFTLNWNGVQH